MMNYLYSLIESLYHQNKVIYDNSGYSIGLYHWYITVYYNNEYVYRNWNFYM